MAIGIGYESSAMSSVADDVDYYRYKYRDYEQQIDGSKVYISYVSPIFSVYERNRFYLLRNSKKVETKPRWKYRPDYVSYDKYGTTAWWQLLLWINDVKSIEYFTTKFIIIPDPDCIAFMRDQIYNVGGYIDINEDEKHKINTWTLHRSTGKNITTTLENIASSSNTAAELVEEKETIFCREIFNMDIPTLRLKYVTLEYEPIPNSLRVIANCRPNLIYDKHYTLTEDNNGVKCRITWDPNVVNNAGLLFKLRENDSVEVQYVRYV